jgi:hypothetical protein
MQGEVALFLINIQCCRTFVLLRRSNSIHVRDNYIRKWAQSDAYGAHKSHFKFPIWRLFVSCSFSVLPYVYCHGYYNKVFTAYLHVYILLCDSVWCVMGCPLGVFLIPANAGVESQLGLDAQHGTHNNPQTSTTPQRSWDVVMRYANYS